MIEVAPGPCLFVVLELIPVERFGAWRGSREFTEGKIVIRMTYAFRRTMNLRANSSELK
jgi:hypothetical protein